METAVLRQGEQLSLAARRRLARAVERVLAVGHDRREAVVAAAELDEHEARGRAVRAHDALEGEGRGPEAEGEPRGAACAQEVPSVERRVSVHHRSQWSWASGRESTR